MIKNNSSVDIALRPLNKVTELAGMLNMEVTYAYEDLVFIGFSEILVQMPDNDSPFNLYIHEDVGEADRDGIIQSFQLKAKTLELMLYYNGTYKLIEKPESKEVDIVFS